MHPSAQDNHKQNVLMVVEMVMVDAQELMSLARLIYVLVLMVVETVMGTAL